MLPMVVNSVAGLYRFSEASIERVGFRDAQAIGTAPAKIRQAIGGLPDKQRAAVLMHKYEEMEYSQIAGVLSCSESAVKSLLFRAYETLRSRLAHMA